MAKRGYGNGSIDQRGESSWRVRYQVGGKTFSKTVHGTKAEARIALRAILRTADTGDHIPPDKMTLGQWIDHWVSVGCPGNKRRKEVGQRAIERYAQLLRVHVVPTLGNRPLQQVQSTEIDKLYVQLSEKISDRTAHHVHVVLGACLGTAKRKRMISRSPLEDLEKVPSPGEADHGMVLEEDQLQELVRGFKSSSLFPIVAVAAFTGARRNEILALRWCDLDIEKKTLRIERAIDDTEKFGLRLKGPKKEAHKRTIAIDDDTVSLLVTEREKHLRIAAGVPDGAPVDLSLVKLPADALMFPNPPGSGESFSFTRFRNPRNTTKEFKRKASGLGFADLRFHDLRGTHESHLLDAGMSPAAVSNRCGHDPATMLRSYAKRTKKADAKAAEIIGLLSKGALQ